MTALQASINHNSVSIVEPELHAALEKALDQLEVLLEQPGNETLTESFTADLAEVGGIFRMVQLDTAFQLVESIGQAVDKLMSRGQPVEDREKEAIFNSLYTLARYFEYVLIEGDVCPLLLAPAFYSLAQVGLQPVVAESQLMDFEIELKTREAERIVSQPDDWPELSMENGRSMTFRRLRHMYQVGLVGMLRGEKLESSTMMIGRACDRALSLCEGTQQQGFWQLVNCYVRIVENKQLELTAQRRHFFSRIDRSFKTLEHEPCNVVNTLPAQGIVNELALLVMLSGDAAGLDVVNQLANGAVLEYRDAGLAVQRRQMERSTYEAMDTMLESVRTELTASVQLLDAMAESGVCEQSDADFLVSRCKTMHETLRVGGFHTEASPLRLVMDTAPGWADTTPDSDKMLEVANIFLYLESAINTRLRHSGDPSKDEKQVVADGLLQQAHSILYAEAKANLGLAKRAVTSYIESGFDREHIANVAQCLEAVRGAFHIIKFEKAERLMQICAVNIDGEYNKEGEHAVEPLEALADALVTTEYLLEELIAGRSAGSDLETLLDSSAQALA